MEKGEGYTLHDTKMNYTDRCACVKIYAGTLVSFCAWRGFEPIRPCDDGGQSTIESIPAGSTSIVAVVKLADGTYMPLDPTWVPFCRELWSAEQQGIICPVYLKVPIICATARTFLLRKITTYACSRQPLDR